MHTVCAGGIIAVNKSNSTSVMPDKNREDAKDTIIPLITEALQQGDYGNKLTISIQNCYGANADKKRLESGYWSTSDSTLHALAKSLADKGVFGVRLTGTTSKNAVNYEGSLIAIDAKRGAVIKSSESQFKEQITIKDHNTLAIQNNRGTSILKRIGEEWPAQKLKHSNTR